MSRFYSNFVGVCKGCVQECVRVYQGYIQGILGYIMVF